MKEKSLSREKTRLSPWVTVVERTYCDHLGKVQGPFHSFELHDYVSILALTKDNRVPLVRQYRPALDKITLELPGGLLDSDITPVQCAEAELSEETGYRLSEPLQSLGCLDPDTGRLENHFWGFFAPSVVDDKHWSPEPGIERVLMAKNDLVAAIANGQFIAALHISLVALALLNNKL